MTDPPPHRETSDDSGTQYEAESRTGIPRWVKVVGIILAVLAVLVVVVMLIGGGGGHGPSRHGMSDDTGGQTRPAAAGVAADDHDIPPTVPSP